MVLAHLLLHGSAQSPRRDPAVDLDAGYAFFRPEAQDNILDKDHGNAIGLFASVMWRDTTRDRESRFGLGAGVAMLVWDGQPLLPVFIQVELRPWEQARTFSPIDPERLGFDLRMGAVLGAWKQTTTGQLSGGQYYHVGVRYALDRKKKWRTWLEIGTGMLGMRGSYEVVSDGVWEERDPDFPYAQFALGVAW